MFARQSQPVLFCTGGRPPSPATSRHHQDALRDPPSLVSIVPPSPTLHHRRCLSVTTSLPLLLRRRISDRASPTPCSTRSTHWPRELTQSLSQITFSKSVAKPSLSPVLFNTAKISFTTKVAVTEREESLSNWMGIPSAATELPEPPVPPDPPPRSRFAGAQFYRRSFNHRATEPPHLSDPEEPARISHCSHAGTMPPFPIGKYTSSNLPTVDQVPTVDASPTGIKKVRICLGQVSTWRGPCFTEPNCFISPLNLGVLFISSNSRLRQLRHFPIDFAHGSRVRILMPSKNLLSSKTVYD